METWRHQSWMIVNIGWKRSQSMTKKKIPIGNIAASSAVVYMY